MAKTQMAFDFGDLPQKPLPENIFVAEEKIIPAEEKIASVEVAIVASEEKMITSSEEEVLQTETVIPEKKATAAKPVENNNAPKEKSTRGRKSIKEMSAGVELIEVPEDAILFQKMYYTIGKVAEMFKVNQSLIRLWENEFDVLKPKKNGKGDRLFRPEDIKNIHLIYHLMRERKYTMEGAKEFIKNNKRANEKFVTIESLKKLKGFLVELKANL
jgi:DNA-binding transcriptional MerR regulator